MPSPSSAQQLADAAGHQPPQLPVGRMIDLLQQRWQQACDQLSNRETLSLEQAIRIGLLNNPILSKAYADIQAAEWRATAVRREWIPSLTVNNPTNPPWSLSVESASGSQSNSVTPLSHITTDRFYTSPRLRLEWSFIDPTRTPRLKSDLALAHAQQLLFDVSTRNLILDIQEAYFALQEKKELRDDYTHIYHLTKDQISKAEILLQSGNGSKGDLDQLRSQLLQQLTQLTQIYEQELIAANQLAYVLSLSPGRLLVPSERLQPFGEWNTPLQSSIAEALALREEIKANLATAESLGWRSRARLNQVLPALSLLGQSQLTTTDQWQLSTGSQRSWTESSSAQLANTIGLNVNWLLFDGGRSSADAGVLGEQALASRSQADMNRLLVTLQVQNSHATYTSNRMIIDIAKEQLTIARRTVDFTARNYNGATIAATTFIQNVQGYLDAARTYKASVRSYNSAIASLNRYSARWPANSLDQVRQRAMGR